jgi:ribosomal protein S18 acetylase RimI-like enzyme
MAWNKIGMTMTDDSTIAPTRLDLNGTNVSLRPMKDTDKQAVLAFAGTLPPHDLLFLARDIRQEKVVDAWIAQSGEDGSITTLLAVDDEGNIRGCLALVRDDLSWSPHVADVRILVGTDSRSMGLGRLLALHGVDRALADEVEKLTVRMTPDQDGAIRMFEELGFCPEAMLRDHVRDASGETNDILIMALRLDRYSATHAAYSL